jgi:hypothetical protein
VIEQGLAQNGKRPRRRPGRYAPRSRTDRLVLFA